MAGSQKGQDVYTERIAQLKEEKEILLAAAPLWPAEEQRINDITKELDSLTTVSE